MKGKNVILSLILISCFILFGYYYKSMYVSNSIEAINMKAMNKKYVYPLLDFSVFRHLCGHPGKYHSLYYIMLLPDTWHHYLYICNRFRGRGLWP
mgnify:CR=1 FL=1